MRQLKISKQITNRDSISFNKFLTEVGTVGDVITPEREIELAKKIKEGDIDARNELTLANLRFVISVAKQYASQGPLSDLVNEGNLGLIKAAERFDETKGFKFISYAVWWIRQSILQYLAENDNHIRLPLNKIGMLSKIKKAKSYLQQINQREPSNDEISDYLSDIEMSNNGDPSKFSDKKVSEVIFSSSKISSLDAPVNSEVDSGNMLDLLEGDSEYDINKLLTSKDLELELQRVISTLTSREQQVLVYSFGLFGRSEMTLEEIGIMIGLTRERIRQIRETSIRKLKGRVRRTTLNEYV